MNIAIFGAGCFWCVEAIFQQLNGVSDVVSGYTGGNTKNPTYKEICSGSTKHIEVCKIEYDSRVITYEDLLNLANWSNCLELRSSSSNSFGRCVGGYSFICFNYVFKKKFKLN